MKRLVSWGAAVAMGLMTSNFATAEPVKLVTGDDYKPYTDQKLPEGGMLTEVVKAAMAAAEQPVEISFSAWKRGYEEAKSGAFGGTFPYLKNDARMAEMDYSEAMYVIKQQMFVAAGSAINAAGLDELKGKKICNPTGYAVQASVQKMVDEKTLELVPASDMGGCLKVVISGRADFVQGDIALIQETLKSSGGKVDEVRALNFVIEEAGLFLVGGKGLPTTKAAIDAFNKGLAIIKGNGTYDAIVKKHSS